LFENFVSQFNKAFIVDDRWKIFLKGLGNTLTITLGAAVIGILIGVLIAVFRFIATQRDPRKKMTFGNAVILVLDLIRELADEGMTMVIVTHEMGFAKEVATRVMFVDEGQIKEQNAPKEFFENPQNPRLKEFLSKVL